MRSKFAVCSSLLLLGASFQSADAQVIRRLTQFTDPQADADSAKISADGTQVFFMGTADPLGANPIHATQIFRMNPSGTTLAQVTTIADGAIKDATAWSIAPDASMVTYTVATLACGWHPVLYSIHADGTGFVPFSGSCNNIFAGPVFWSSSPTSSIIYQYLAIPIVTGADLYRAPSGGGAPVRITNDGDGSCWRNPRVSESGNWVAYTSCTNDDGQNPNELYQVFRIQADGTGRQRIAFGGFQPDISGDGSKIVFSSSTDPLGTNGDLNEEIFLYDAATQNLRQLTSTTGGFNENARITLDGSWVYFRSVSSYFGEPVRSDVYRVSVATGLVERISGCFAGAHSNGNPEPDRTGGRAVFTGIAENPSAIVDVFLVDFAAQPTIRVGKTAPTIVTWDEEPKPLRYDVIRGDLANLSLGPGGTVQLGAVTCIEDESTDNGTAGNEDVAQPSSGQVFFYLQRGTQGIADGPGSWGQGTGARERIAGPGSCPS